jgi:hypothetical protein
MLQSKGENGSEVDEKSIDSLLLDTADDALCGKVAPIKVLQPTDGSKGFTVDYGVVTSVVSHSTDALPPSARRRQQDRKLENGNEKEPPTNGQQSRKRRQQDRKGEEDTDTKGKVRANGAGNGAPKMKRRRKSRA